jgi:hypothetical protein
MRFVCVCRSGDACWWRLCMCARMMAACLHQVFESNAGDLTPELFEEHALPRLLDIAERVKVPRGHAARCLSCCCCYCCYCYCRCLPLLLLLLLLLSLLLLLLRGCVVTLPLPRHRPRVWTHQCASLRGTPTLRMTLLRRHRPSTRAVAAVAWADGGLTRCLVSPPACGVRACARACVRVCCAGMM